jgi:CHAD domain-containing protein
MVARRFGQAVKARARVMAGGDPDSVHDLRVATRRLQEIFGFIEPSLPGRPCRRLNRRLRDIRRRFGPIRNVDVMRDLVRRFAERLPRSQARGLASLAARLQNEADALRRSGRGARGGLKVPGLKKRSVALLEDLRLPPTFSAARRGRDVLSARVRKLEEALPRSRTGDAAALHALRIAVKRYRYCLEILEESGACLLRPSLAAARSLQTHLGRLHDIDVLIGLAGEEAAGSSVRRLLPSLRRERAESLRRGREAVEGFDPSKAVSILDEVLAREAAA